ncbi:glutathione S-transferase [Altererythrobacter aerius]|uniref:glutathione transferase n=1 Tax=Tsuneonella aeria TaxID=1837929 RepID=A0A6I4TEA2_9SPHN|nr:glutathione S-transferase family protein [Tsuneonella aeria]MXO74460.1 glutathione S-transferase [Tsuneonella aeria]
MLTVHHLRISQSERVVWLCEELGLDYDLRLYTRRSDNNLAPDEYKALHPMGIAPVITDGDLVLGESGAICEYIDRTYGKARHSPGPDDADFAGHLLWFHFSNATFMATGMMGLVARRLGADPLPDFVADRTAKAWQLAEARLAEAPFFGGRSLTTADIMMGFNLTTARMFGGADLSQFPHIAAYLKRIGERPAYRRAMEKCEPGVTPKLD